MDRSAPAPRPPEANVRDRVRRQRFATSNDSSTVRRSRDGSVPAATAMDRAVGGRRTRVTLRTFPTGDRTDRALHNATLTGPRGEPNGAYGESPSRPSDAGVAPTR